MLLLTRIVLTLTTGELLSACQAHIYIYVYNKKLARKLPASGRKINYQIFCWDWESLLISGQLSFLSNLSRRSEASLVQTTSVDMWWAQGTLLPGASGNYKPPAAFEESNCRNIKGIMTCICCWVLASQLASKACNVPFTGIHWHRRGRNMEYDLLPKSENIHLQNSKGDKTAANCAKRNSLPTKVLQLCGMLMYA